MFVYSAWKNRAKRMAPYSVWKPATSSDSASGRSNGRRFVSANAAIRKTRKPMNCGMKFHRCVLLVGHHVPQPEGADRDDDRQHRDGQRQLVADELRRGADRAQQRELVVGGVAGHHQRIDGEARQRQEEQHAGVDVGDHQRDRAAVDRQVGPEGDHHEGGERRQQRQRRGHQVERPVRRRRRDVLLEHELEGVRQRLEEADGADAVRAGAVLDERAGPPLDPVHDRGDVDEDAEHHPVLDQGGDQVRVHVHEGFSWTAGAA